MKELSLFETKIIIKENLIKEVFNYLDESLDIHIITDENVSKLYLKYLLKRKYKTYIIEASEKSKSIENYLSITNEIINNNGSRKSVIVALGGGVVLDLAGFIASTLFRGIEVVYIPTTIIGQIDASIGGKNGIDLQNKKNMLGSFKNPTHVLIDPKVLDTLPIKEYRNGLGEVLKTALISDSRLFEKMNDRVIFDENLIYDLISIKAQIVKDDYYDEGIRKILNFGHTLGHAIEAKSNFKYSHGEAVVYGMMYALSLGVKLGITESSLYTRVVSCFNKHGLGLENMPFDEYLDYVKYDKKHDLEMVDFIFLSDIGKPTIKKIKLS